MIGEKTMSPFIANSIIKRKNTQGFEAAQELYRKYFINTALYMDYKADVDMILTAEGYSDCIVEA